MTSHNDHDGTWVSIRAVTWVIDDAPVPADLMPELIVIARRCDAHGRGSYQSLPTIAAKTGRSVHQTQRNVTRLRDLGLLELGNQAIVEYLPAGRRPIVYDLPLHLRGPKPGRESKNPTGRKKVTPSIDAGGPADATPSIDAGSTTAIHAGGRPSMDGPCTPGMDAVQTDPVNKTFEQNGEQPSLPGALPALLGELLAASDVTDEEREPFATHLRSKARTSLVGYLRSFRPGDMQANLDEWRTRHAPARTPGREGRPQWRRDLDERARTSQRADHDFTPDESGRFCVHLDCHLPRHRHRGAP